MFLNVGSKLFGWLAGLALCPMVGAVQVLKILQHPQNATVCVGEEAVFTAKAITIRGFSDINWLLNETALNSLPDNERNHIHIVNNAISTTRRTELTICYNRVFNETSVRLNLLGDPHGVDSYFAYLFYEPNQQYQVSGLKGTVNNTTAQVDWNKPDSNLTTRFLIGVYDGDNNLIANQTTDTNHFSFDIPPRVNGTCQYLEFRVTADQCPDPGSDFIQTEATTFIYTKPDASPVTVRVDNKAVLVSWPSDGGSTYRIVVTDLDNGNQTQALHDIPPYAYTAKKCGKLNFAISPVQCTEPAFIHSANISLNIDCPNSGTQASYSSLLLAITAAIPLLKWQH